MDSKILGDNMQALVLNLAPQEKVYAEAGSMMYLRGGVEMDVEMKGGLMGGIKRMFSGESLFLATFEGKNGAGEVAFASPFPGKIAELAISGQKNWLCQRDAFICCTSNVNVDITLSKRLGAGFFGGEGFILEKLSGEGTAFVHAGGNFVEFDLAAGESLRVDTGCIVAFEESVDYDIKFIGGIKRTLFGGEGLFYALMTGPGKVYLQTLPFSRLADRVLSAAGGGVEEKRGVRAGNIGLDIVGDMFGK